MELRIKKEENRFLFYTTRREREKKTNRNSHPVIDATVLLIVLRSIFFSPHIHFSFSLPLPRFHIVNARLRARQCSSYPDFIGR